jgi:hypothetical protein
MKSIHWAATMVVLGTTLATSCQPDAAVADASRWWRGNTHTHTLWSDGNDAPERVTKWYKDQGYHFLVLSDHNLLSVGEKWVTVTPSGPLTPERLQQLREEFEVEVREQEGGTQMRLRTLPELRQSFDEPEQFLLIQGEEVTDSFDRKPVHINGLNLQQAISPQGGDSVVDTLNRNVEAILEHGRRQQRTTLAHINHPNFGWGLTWREVAQVASDRFFEVYNGHNAVANYGDAQHPSTEQMWDQALTLRLTELGLGLLYGVATDDSHDYHDWAVGRPNPGRGWIMVRAAELSAETILTAARRGDFYASSGVSLTDVLVDADQYQVHIAGEEGVTYVTRFLGTRVRGGEVGEPGEVLLETSDNPARYPFTGDELYVRATVVSSRLHPNPYAEGDFETAWAQPVQPR